MKEIVEYIVKSLAESPKDIEVELENENNVEIIKVKVNSSDMGRVIGKGGKIANCIRTIAKSIYQKQNKRVIVKIEEK